MSWLNRIWWLPAAVLIFLVYRLLASLIPATLPRVLAAAAIVTVGGVLVVAVLAALRGLFDRPG